MSYTSKARLLGLPVFEYRAGALVSVGGVAIGGAAFGVHAALGGLALAGTYATGGVAIAAHANDPAAAEFFRGAWFFERAERALAWSWLLLALPVLIGLAARLRVRA